MGQMEFFTVTRTFLRLSIIGLIAISNFARTAGAQCECGYTVKSDHYTHGIVTLFSRLLNADDITDGSGNELKDWEVQDWGTNGTGTPGENNYALPRQNTPENLWIQGGLLQMKQSAYSEDDAEEGSPVKVAEIVTRRGDILYGSFRSRFSINVEDGTEGGTVVGFFFYHVCCTPLGFYREQS